VSSVVTAPGGAPSRPSQTAPKAWLERRAITADFVLGLGLAATLVLVALVSTGGNSLTPNTWVQVALVVLGAVAAIAVVVLSAPGRAWGGVTAVLFAAVAALTYASIAWSVQPATSWLEANRTASYLAAFGIAIALSRLAPGRWRALLGGIATATTVISGYALLVKVFPGGLDSSDPLGRLLAPFGYWNATALMAAMGIPACLWAGGRRETAGVLRALSVPAIAILIAALVLSYSRGALLVAAVGVGAWFTVVPLRLRAALMLALGAAGGAAIAAWALATHSISADGVPLQARVSAGHGFGLVILVVLALTTLAGFAAAFAIDRADLSPRLRHRVGAVLVGLVALIPVGGVVSLVASTRGFTGEISHVWQTLTNPNGGTRDTAGRLVDLSNSRPHYWSEGLTIGEHHLLAGAGALGFETAHLRYSGVTWNVQHAHSYVIETFADFGLIGVAVSLALLVAWALAARRTVGLQWPRRSSLSPRGPPDSDHASERIGLLTLLAVVLTFGVHSLIDWTWFIPGTAVVALACAGWLAGRGPLAEPIGTAPQRRSLYRSPGAGIGVASIAAITILLIWVIVQPLRSSDAYASALSAAARGDSAAALTAARDAAASDPLSVDPDFLLSRIYAGLGNSVAARGELTDAVSLQPGNPASWQQLGEYDLSQHRPRPALSELHRALVLDPASPQVNADIAAAHSALSAAAPKK
jgi:hypothetical protein